MQRRHLVPLGLAVTALFVLAAFASRGRPLGGGKAGPGPTPGFFDYVFTSVVLVGAAIALVAVWALLSGRPSRRGRPPVRQNYLGAVAALIAVAAVAWFLGHDRAFLHRLEQLRQQTGQTQTAPPAPGPASTAVHGSRSAHLRWDEVAIVLALLAAGAVAALAVRSRRRAPVPADERERREVVSAALDESLDDLLADPDLRRAIVAAYARMERALAAAGLPRRPAEAPFEFAERALLQLDASAGAARRLTGLFEWAKFSHHEPEPEMRDEAVAALVAVRDELRAPAAAETAGAAR